MLIPGKQLHFQTPQKYSRSSISILGKISILAMEVSLSQPPEINKVIKFIWITSLQSSFLDQMTAAKLLAAVIAQFHNIKSRANYYYYYYYYLTCIKNHTPQPFHGPFSGTVPVLEENFWTLWCKGRLTETGTSIIRMGATPSRLSSAHLHHPLFFTGRMPFLPPDQQCQSTEGN